MLRSVHSNLRGAPATPGEECRKGIGLVAHDRDRERLEELEGAGDVKDGLGACADDGDGGGSQFCEIGRDVAGGFSSPMHPSYPPRHEDPYACHARDLHGGGDGSRPVLLAGEEKREVPACRLAHSLTSLGEQVQGLTRSADVNLAMEDRDGCRHCSSSPDHFLHLQRHVVVAGVGHAVRDDGGLQRHDGLVVCHGCENFLRIGERKGRGGRGRRRGERS
mmetsp:Transcript_2315/g.7052  ORF Transcript_2315/g.7052 Transcript_2315/m.7052 type:complete len:220 (-) Transcript_2315:124-783(-)